MCRSTGPPAKASRQAVAGIGVGKVSINAVRPNEEGGHGVPTKEKQKGLRNGVKRSVYRDGKIAYEVMLWMQIAKQIQRIFVSYS